MMVTARDLERHRRYRAYVSQGVDLSVFELGGGQVVVYNPDGVATETLKADNAVNPLLCR